MTASTSASEKPTSLLVASSATSKASTMQKPAGVFTGAAIFAAILAFLYQQYLEWTCEDPTSWRAPLALTGFYLFYAIAALLGMRWTRQRLAKEAIFKSATGTTTSTTAVGPREDNDNALAVKKCAPEKEVVKTSSCRVADEEMNKIKTTPASTPPTTSLLDDAASRLAVAEGAIWVAIPKPFVEGLMASYNVFQISFNSGWCLLVLLTLHQSSQPLLGSVFDYEGFCNGGSGSSSSSGGSGKNYTSGLGLDIFFRSISSPGTTSDNINNTLGFLLWVHYANKPIEFLDTFFMVQRGKAPQQLTFLHVYHHALMVFAWYMVVRYYPGGDSWFGAWVNSFIHVLMYTYYFVASFGVKIPSFVKKTMTRLQMLQFCICFGHAVLVSSLGIGSTPDWLCGLQIYVMVNMLLLFGNFYFTAYRQRSTKSSGGNSSAAATSAPEGKTKKQE
ncbi:unnamed protein product [Amoebophrya sp. A120]|nr:unnamed protein product [Amoebophrya sp. A120]|eukprot:GSA120T00008358001.1